jgi:hypothetical protein
VEIFFDPNNSKDLGRGAQQYEGQYVFTANGAWRDNEANNPTFGESGDWYAATTRTFMGYQVEFKVKKSALLNPADGSAMGFHIAVNDDDGTGRKMQMGWSGRAHSEFTYGTLALGGAITGTIKIEQIVVSGNDLKITIATFNPSGAHTIQKTSSLAPLQWTDMAGVSFAPGAAGRIVATFPKPSRTLEFYRVVLR